MQRALGKWVFGKVAAYLEFTLHEVVLRRRFLKCAAASLITALVVMALLLYFRLSVKLAGLPLVVWVFVAALLLCTILVARSRWKSHLQGPAGESMSRIVFAGFYEARADGRLFRGARSIPLERSFLRSLDRELGDHRLNTSGLWLDSSPLSVTVVDWRSPRGFAETYDEESFQGYLQGLSHRSIGVVWATVTEDGSFGVFDVLGDEDHFHGGPLYTDMMQRVCALAEVPNVRTSTLTILVAKALAAFYGLAYCDPLGDNGNPLDTLPVLHDSKRLLNEIVRELRSSNDPDATATAEKLDRLLRSQIVRQEAWGLWIAGRKAQALPRLVEALEIDLFNPLPGEAEFKVLCESVYNHSISQLREEWRIRLTEESQQTPTDPAIVHRFIDRVRVNYPPPALEMLVNWIQLAHSDRLDSETLTEELFTKLDSRYPNNAYVHYYWGEARRIVFLLAGDTDPEALQVARVDRAIERFERAYELDPDLELAAMRIDGLLVSSAVSMEDSAEAKRRIGRGMAMIANGSRYLEAHLPEGFADRNRRKEIPEDWGTKTTDAEENRA